MIYCPGNVTTSATGVAICSDGAGNPVQWVNSVPFDFTQLDGPTLAGCFGVGFTLIGMCWFAGKAVGTVVKAIKDF